MELKRKRQAKNYLKINVVIKKGFTLVEMLIVIAIVAIVVLIVIATINPIEQLHKAQDSANLANAENLMGAIERYHASNEGEHPKIQIFTNSLLCEDIIDAGPVTDIEVLKYELSEWFPKEIMDQGSELYAGYAFNSVKVCSRVKSSRNIADSVEDGCNVGYLYYLCIPR